MIFKTKKPDQMQKEFSFKMSLNPEYSFKYIFYHPTEFHTKGLKDRVINDLPIVTWLKVVEMTSKPKPSSYKSLLFV